MKLKDARENYYFFSGKASDLVRQLGLAAIAVIWIFKFEVSGTPKIPSELGLPLALVVAGLTFDFLQYAVAACVWGIFQRRKEVSGTTEDLDFLAPQQINWFSIGCFTAKIICVVWAYALLLKFVASRLL